MKKLLEQDFNEQRTVQLHPKLAERWLITQSSFEIPVLKSVKFLGKKKEAPLTRLRLTTAGAGLNDFS